MKTFTIYPVVNAKTAVTPGSYTIVSGVHMVDEAAFESSQEEFDSDYDGFIEMGYSGAALVAEDDQGNQEIVIQR